MTSSERVLVASIMSQDVVTLAHRQGALTVLDGEGHLVGILSSVILFVWRSCCWTYHRVERRKAVTVRYSRH